MGHIAAGSTHQLSYVSYSFRTHSAKLKGMDKIFKIKKKKKKNKMAGIQDGRYSSGF